MKTRITAVILLIVFVLLPVSCQYVRADVYNTGSAIADAVQQQLQLSTSNDALTFTQATEFAREGVSQAAYDIGVAFSKQVYSTAGAMGLLVDTGVITITSVSIDSTFYDYSVPVRSLKPTTIEDMLTKALHGQKDITDGQNATHYNFLPGSDSIWVAPISANQDTFQVTGYKRAAVLEDSTSTTDLPYEYRRPAILYALYLASEMLDNGRADEFLNRYDWHVKRIWVRRFNERGFLPEAKP